MKKFWVVLAGLLLGVVLAHAQDIPHTQVPSVVLNAFKKDFPKASDIEWEIKNNTYKVDFEIGFTDHELILDNTGKTLKHKQDIKENDLPEAVALIIAKDFTGFKLSDISKTTANGSLTIKLDLKKSTEEWEIVFDETGKILDKKAD